MCKCVTIWIYEESDPIYIVANLRESFHQSTALTFSRIISLLGLIQQPTFIVTQVPVIIIVCTLANPPLPDGLQSMQITICPALSRMSNIFNAGALQSASSRIAIRFVSSVSQCVSMSFHQIRNWGPLTIAYTSINNPQCMHRIKNFQQSVRFSHRGEFYSWMSFDSYDHFLISLQTNMEIFSLFQHRLDFFPETVPPTVSTLACMLSRFWRCSMTTNWTPGGVSSSSSLYQIFG